MGRLQYLPAEVADRIVDACMGFDRKKECSWFLGLRQVCSIFNAVIQLYIAMPPRLRWPGEYGSIDRPHEISRLALLYHVRQDSSDAPGLVSGISQVCAELMAVSKRIPVVPDNDRLARLRRDGYQEAVCGAVLQMNRYTTKIFPYVATVEEHEEVLGERDRYELCIASAAYADDAALLIELLSSPPEDDEDHESLFQHPFYVAAGRGSLSAARAMVEKFPNRDMCAITGDYGETALHYAAQEGHLPLVEFLLTLPGCNVNVLNGDSTTPLQDACIYDHPAIVECLLKVPDIDPTFAPPKEKNALDWALLLNRKAVVAHLLQHEACSVSLGNDGMTGPVHRALAKGDLEYALLLLDHVRVGSETDPRRAYDYLSSTVCQQLCEHPLAVPFLDRLSSLLNIHGPP